MSFEVWEVCRVRGIHEDAKVDPSGHIRLRGVRGDHSEPLPAVLREWASWLVPAFAGTNWRARA